VPFFPTVFAVFERKSGWETIHPELAQSCDFSRFLEDEQSITTILEEIANAGIPVQPIDYTQTDLADLLVRLRSTDEALLWNLTDGYDYYAGANIPAFARLAGLRHVGSGSYAQMLCQNKPHLKAVAASFDVPVATGVSFRIDAAQEPVVPARMKPPFFVKPARLDNSIGDQAVIPLCSDADAALAAIARLMAVGIDEVSLEEFLPGDEFSVVAADGGEWCAECAKVTYAGSYFDSIAKDSDAYACEFVQDGRAAAMIAFALRLAAGIKLRDYFRADFRCDAEGTPRLLEVNSSPFLVSHAYDRLGTSHFGSRSALLGAIVRQSYRRQSAFSENSAGAR
jgi:D-alanine-D-alanine ligase-like ATP-grasp enzyme